MPLLPLVMIKNFFQLSSFPLLFVNFPKPITLAFLTKIGNIYMKIAEIYVLIKNIYLLVVYKY